MTPYGKFIETLLDFTVATDAVDFINDTIKVAAMTNSYMPASTDEYFSDISTNEASGSGYITGGYTLVNKSSAPQDDFTIWAADSIEVTNVLIPDLRYFVVYKDTGTPSTSKLISYEDVGKSEIINQPLVLTFASGFLRTSKST